MNPELVTAIQQRRLVQFFYAGLPRLVEPYLYGLDANTGREVLSGVQVEGASRSAVPGWKMFHLDEIADFQLTSRRFTGLNPEYNPKDPLIRPVFARA